MPIPMHHLDELLTQFDDTDIALAPKRGDEIFEGLDYPRSWDGFVGQEKAKEQLLVTAASAKAREARMEHTLLASGIPGVGKSTLATLLAFQAGVGLIRCTGPLSQEEARRLLLSMDDRDVLFIDEIHTLVAGNKNRADWILPLMTEGRLYTASGAEKMPDVTIVGATTDVGKLPQTLVSRFMIQPTITPYDADEAQCIVANLADRMRIDDLSLEDYRAIARAADHNPRVMRQILTQVRDLRYAYPDTFPNMDKALEWAGVSPDGLSVISRDILMLLLVAHDNTLSLDAIKANLGEPGPIAQHEQQLLGRRLIEVTSRGRKLTAAGATRARDEAQAHRQQRASA